LKTKGCLLSSLEDKRLSSFLPWRQKFIFFPPLTTKGCLLSSRRQPFVFKGGKKITFCLQGRKEDNLLSSREERRQPFVFKGGKKTIFCLQGRKEDNLLSSMEERR
jgi:hypothetical protein